MKIFFAEIGEKMCYHSIFTTKEHKIGIGIWGLNGFIIYITICKKSNSRLLVCATKVYSTIK